MFPLGKKAVAGGEVTFCTTLKGFFVFFGSVPEGQRGSDRGKSKENQSEYKEDKQIIAVPGRGESLEWKRTGDGKKRTCKWMSLTRGDESKAEEEKKQVNFYTC